MFNGMFIQQIHATRFFMFLYDKNWFAFKIKTKCITNIKILEIKAMCRMDRICIGFYV
jgi:hypothetical protein